MTTVLIAIDGSEHSVAVAQAARRLFGDQPTYLAVNVASEPMLWAPEPVAWGGVYPYAPPYPLVGDDIAVQATDEAEDQARATAGIAAATAGLAADPIGEVGDTTDAILRAAREHGADVIVVGASDKDWWRRLFEGSVSRHLLRESTFPVLVVPAAEAARG